MADDSQPTEGTHQRFFAELAGFCSLGAGIVHAGAVGLHAEHATAARVFVVLALLQVGSGLALLLAPPRWLSAVTLAVVNAAALIGWVLTRTTGIAWIPGLEVAESPQLADVLCAVLAFISIGAVTLPLARVVRSRRTPQPALTGAVAVILTVPALWSGATHVHSHADSPRETTLEIAADGVIVVRSTTTSVALGTSTTQAGATTPQPANPPARPKPSPVTTVAPQTTSPSQSHTHSTTPEQRLAAASGWPRPFDPAVGPDLEGVGGVTEVQARRARDIIEATARDIARYADMAAAEADGYRSIGDGLLGYEHYVKWSLIQDGRVLDSTAVESLVYKVSGSSKVLVSAMYIAQPGTDINDPTLVNYAGPLMQWHVHSNLCWSNGRVVGITDDNGDCIIGSASGGVLSPMVHVWIAAHPCGPFAAVEGVAAGVAQASNEERLDLCNRH